MKSVEVYVVKPPVITSKRISQGLKSKLELILYQYKFRKAVYSFRKKWDIPIDAGLSMANVLSIKEETWLDCCGKTPKSIFGSEYIYTSYWDWHKQHREAVHSEKFHEELKLLLNLFDEPLPLNWFGFIFYVVLFNDPNYPPSQSIEIDGISTSDVHLSDNAGEYKIVVNSKADTPYLEIRLFRDIKDKEWDELRNTVRDEMKSFSKRLGTKASTQNLSKIADFAREFNNDDKAIAWHLENETQIKIKDETQLRMYRKRARDLGL